MDTGQQRHPFPGYTTQELRDWAPSRPEGIRRQMEAEIARREADTLHRDRTLSLSFHEVETLRIALAHGLRNERFAACSTLNTPARQRSAEANEARLYALQQRVERLRTALEA